MFQSERSIQKILEVAHLTKILSTKSALPASEKNARTENRIVYKDREVYKLIIDSYSSGKDAYKLQSLLSNPIVYYLLF